MSTEVKKPKPTKAQLERKIMELESQLIYRLAFASRDIESASIDKLMGSGVILRLDVLGGRQVIEPTMIRDGLSPGTIRAIQADIERTWGVATLNKPKKVSEGE